jgi:hypothetical protein
LKAGGNHHKKPYYSAKRRMKADTNEKQTTYPHPAKGNPDACSIPMRERANNAAPPSRQKKGICVKSAPRGASSRVENLSTKRGKDTHKTTLAQFA